MSSEWRIFFPCIQTENSEANEAYDSLFAYFADASSTEEREDNYLISRPYFGIKHRALKKLELKVREKTLNKESELAGIENWTKTKLGKKEPSHYKMEILEILASSQGTSASGDDDSIISNPRFLNLSKIRRRKFAELVVEICFITFDDPNIDRNGNSEPTKCSWASVCVEGAQEESLLAGVKTIFGPCHPLWKLIGYLLQTSLQSSIDFISQQKVSPLVGGYPTFVAAVCGNLNHAEFEKNVSRLFYLIENFTEKDLTSFEELRATVFPGEKK